MKRPRKFRKAGGADNAGSGLGQLTFGHLRELHIKIGAGGKLQHRISQKFETFIMDDVFFFGFIGIGRMYQSLMQQG